MRHMHSEAEPSTIPVTPLSSHASTSSSNTIIPPPSTTSSHQYNTRSHPIPIDDTSPAQSPLPSSCPSIAMMVPSPHAVKLEDPSSSSTVKRYRCGRTKGTHNFRQADIERLLDCIERIHPIGPDMWEQVENMYNDAPESIVSII